MTNRTELGREDLKAWQNSQPRNFYTSNSHLQRILRSQATASEGKRYHRKLESFGAVAAQQLDRAAEINNRVGNLPRLDRWSPIGARIESVDHHPSYHDCGQAIYGQGELISVYAQPGSNLLAQSLFYLSSHAGEAGHNCPVACTAGLVKALQAAGNQELKDRWLPQLLTNDYGSRLDGAQFLTEVQGGSDVGANCVIARKIKDGNSPGDTSLWAIEGEKWFCSNADADLILLTARYDPDSSGTDGLGLFLLPRLLTRDQVNSFTVRRLKEKIGTRSMPSAEIDFQGARAYALGPPEKGFSTVMKYVINTSRLYNTVGCCGLARRALIIAQTYASSRSAFSKKIIEYPLMQNMLASMRATEEVMLSGALRLASTFDKEETKGLTQDESRFLRVAINLSKMRSCQHSHRIILTAIECLGGNGAIESFSVLPRLLRDNVVYENWEGTHNTLISQSLRDFKKYKLHKGFYTELRSLIEFESSEAQVKPCQTRLRKHLERLALQTEDALSISDSGIAALALKPLLESTADLFFACSYLRDLHSDTREATMPLDVSILDWFVDRFLEKASPRGDAEYVAWIERISTAPLSRSTR